MERTRHEFDVIRLWEQPASLFLQYPGLLPLKSIVKTRHDNTVERTVDYIDSLDFILEFLLNISSFG